ncbi:hypothetical protein H310_15283, partial [Aphanomyces invadans]
LGATTSNRGWPATCLSQSGCWQTLGRRWCPLTDRATGADGGGVTEKVASVALGGGCLSWCPGACCPRRSCRARHIRLGQRRSGGSWTLPGRGCFDAHDAVST